MSVSEERTRLRIAVASGDGAEVVRILKGHPWPVDALQLIGDGLRCAITQGVDDALPLAAVCLAALHNRGWTGDQELIDAFGSAGSPTQARLAPLAVDLEDLAMVLEGDPTSGGGRIDLHTGEVLPEFLFDEAVTGEEVEGADDEERWLWVDCEGSRAGYRDMEWFVDDLEDRDVAHRLSAALGGRGPFRRFKDVLFQWPDLTEQWHSFHEDRQRGRARSWLASAGYAATLPGLGDTPEQLTEAPEGLLPSAQDGRGSTDQSADRASLLHFLSAQREAALAIADGLSEGDAVRSVVPSGWTVLDLLFHLGEVEQHWFAFALGGDPAHTPVVAGKPLTLSSARVAYRAEIERSDRLLALFALDDEPAIVPAQLPGEIATVRDVVLHVIEEIARHAGHLDIARELLDGQTGLGPR